MEKLVRSLIHFKADIWNSNVLFEFKKIQKFGILIRIVEYNRYI